MASDSFAQIKGTLALEWGTVGEGWEGSFQSAHLSLKPLPVRRGKASYETIKTELSKSLSLPLLMLLPQKSAVGSEREEEADHGTLSKGRGCLWLALTMGDGET